MNDDKALGSKATTTASEFLAGLSKMLDRTITQCEYDEIVSGVFTHLPALREAVEHHENRARCKKWKELAVESRTHMVALEKKTNYPNLTRWREAFNAAWDADAALRAKMEKA